MKRVLIWALASTMVWMLSSCESCVRKAARKVTEVTITAAEGVAEALEEGGEKLAEKTTDAAGRIVLGVGKSLERQLNEHAEKVAVEGKSSVQIINDFAGLNEEAKALYEEIPFTDEDASILSTYYIAKYKALPVVDAYFKVENSAFNAVTLVFFNEQGKPFLTRKTSLDKANVKKTGDYLLVSFALSEKQETDFKSVKKVEVFVVNQ